MEPAWCAKCKTGVSLVDAIVLNPCPKCGSREYVIVGQPERTEYDEISDRAEEHMRSGRWAEAETDLRSVCEGADLLLRIMQLKERRSCIDFLDEQHDLGTRYQVVHAMLFSRYDRSTAEWALGEYHG